MSDGRRPRLGSRTFKRVVDKHFHRDTVPELPEGVPENTDRRHLPKLGRGVDPKSVKFDPAHLLPHEMKTPWRRGLRGLTFSATFAMAFYMSLFHQWENPNDEFGIPKRNVFMPIREFYWRKKKEFWALDKEDEY